ncbi:short transient receptor potential channel 4-like isoform X2 [Choristoneura fumiferana]|uniref:short transient receptor potential channel 4-like isoform X2 n=1 Tax=Choristoneura fumiferana TaxID=7141 RepID=UPI003D1546C5
MKSSVSNVTESIENKSLPSIPIRTSILQIQDEKQVRESYPQYEAIPILSEQRYKPCSNHSAPNFSQNLPYTPYIKSTKNSLNSAESSSREGSSTSKDYDNVKTNIKSQWSQKASLRNFWSKIYQYEHLGNLLNEEFIVLKPKDSVHLPMLLPYEAEFLRLVTEDNVSSVQTYLREHPGLNVNCVNYQGVSALHIAVKNRSEAMVEFLLKQPNIEIGDTIMHAVRENNIKILVKLLDTQKEICPGLEFAGSTHSPNFPEHVTPLILAAQSGNYEAVALLVQRGHTIPAPHLPNCLCADCKLSLETDDPLRASSARLAVYRAIASPAFLVHVSSDPILAGFRLTKELAANAAAYRQLSVAYSKLSEEVSAFAVDLIGCCRTSGEVEVILKQTCNQDRRHFKLPRLLMAVDYKQKEFVAHPSTQMVLESYWLGDWFSWKSKSLLTKGFIITSRVFITPLILFMCVVAPRHRLVSHFQIPLNKLITHSAAYFVFLALVFYISNQDKTRQKRGPPNTGAEAPVILYVCGYVWSAVRMCVTQGPRRYFSESWNIFDVTMLMLFGVTFALWVAAARDVAINDEEEMERKYWDQYNPTLLAEGTFCLATILAYFRLMLLCQLNYHLGPLQVSLGKMTVDIYKYLTVFAIIISAFAAGLTRFYQYYDGMVYEDEAGMKTVQVSSFTSLSDTLNTLFWALFCMAPLESADVILENRSLRDKAHRNRHTYTERIGYFCFGIFEVISVIVVLNMLIATMSNTFQRVINNVNTEWTFGRTEVYLNYISQTTLPSPYNLIPTASGVKGVVEWLCAKTRRQKGARVPLSCSQTSDTETDIEAPVQKEYAVLMSVLVQRYFRDKESESSCGGVEGEIETLRRELTAIRTLLEKTSISQNQTNLE